MGGGGRQGLGESRAPAGSSLRTLPACSPAVGALASAAR